MAEYEGLRRENEALKRQRAELDRFEQEELAFFEKVRTGYLNRAECDSRFKIIDASRSIDDVQDALREVLKPLLDRTS